jgi:hypothetical protein
MFGIAIEPHIILDKYFLVLTKDAHELSIYLHNFDGTITAGKITKSDAKKIIKFLTQYYEQ